MVFTTRARVFRAAGDAWRDRPRDGTAPRRILETRRRDLDARGSGDRGAAAHVFAAGARRGDLFLLIEEGDNQPLPIEKATVLLPSYALRLFRRPDLPLRLIYGRDDLQAPSTTCSYWRRS